MECKFLDSYSAVIDGADLEVWYCRRGDPAVLGRTRDAAARACAACRQSDYGRSPGDLIDEIDRRNHELMALTAIVAAENTAIDLAAILSTAIEVTMETLAADAGWIALARADCFEVAVYRGVSAEYIDHIQTLCADDDLVGRALRERETLVVDDIYAGPETLPFARREGLASMLLAPVKTEDQLLGVLVVATREPRAHSADDTYFVNAAAAQLAAAIDHAVLYRARADRVEIERRLLEAVENVNLSLGRRAAAPTVMVEAAQLMGAAKAALLRVRGDALIAEDVYNLSDSFKRQFLLPLGDSLSGEAIRRGETVACPDVDGEEMIDPYLVAEGGYRALITAPLQSYRGTYGAISVFFDDPRDFDDDDRRLLRTFAGQAAIALENERLLHERDALARIDGLTGVANRAFLEATLEHTMHQMHRNGGIVSLLFIDVDGLKAVNDRFGHQAGDGVLRDLAAVLTRGCRETDLVARYGGDEFVVLMPDTDAAGAGLVRQKVEAAIAEIHPIGDTDQRVTASIGAHTATWPDAQRLLIEADKRMYEAKRGRSAS
jgi:diguanylate cyclase (GGDEF)-like protein